MGRCNHARNVAGQRNAAANGPPIAAETSRQNAEEVRRLSAERAVNGLPEIAAGD